MTTINRSIESEHDRAMAARLIENRAVPFTLTLTDGKHRSTAQNRLQHMWMNEIAQQKGDMTPAEVRAYCKLTIGVPILRNQNEAFRAKYDEVVKPLPYQHKLAVMTEPLDLPVTRIMTTKQTAEYLDGIIRHFGEQGIVLTIPEDLRDQINDHKTPDPDADSSPASDQEAGEVDPPVSSPASPFLVRFARDVFTMAMDSETTGATFGAVMKRWHSETEKLDPDDKAKAEQIGASAKRLFNDAALYDGILEFYCEMLGCEPHDLTSP